VAQKGGNVLHVELVAQFLSTGAKAMTSFLIGFFALSGILAWLFAIFVICFIYLED
jgi:hypothetical protein